MADGPGAVQVTPVDEPWQVVEDGEICVLAFEGGERGTMGISGARQLAGLLNDRAARTAPPPLVLVVDVLHAELSEVAEMGEGRPIAEWAPWLAAINGLEGYPSFTVAAIRRQASCGGLELALAADVRVAGPTARLGVLETRMGILPGAGGTQRLPRLVGQGNAALLVLTGETVSGATAATMGLVQLVDDDPVALGRVWRDGLRPSLPPPWPRPRRPCPHRATRRRTASEPRDAPFSPSSAPT